jgi:hypothetical protein
VYGTRQECNSSIDTPRNSCGEYTRFIRSTLRRTFRNSKYHIPQRACGTYSGDYPLANVMYITRYSDPLSAEHHVQSYDRYRFYAPAMTKLAELAGGDVYLQTRYDPTRFRDGGALSRMHEVYRLPKRYDSASRIDLIFCAIFFPQGERFRRDIERFEQTLADTGAPYIYHDSDKEFSTGDETDLYHPAASGYFLDVVSRLPRTSILRDRLRHIATSIPDSTYVSILQTKFPDIPVVYMPAMCWANYSTRFHYISSEDREFDYSVLREHYLNKSKSLFVQRHGQAPLSMLIGSPSGRPSRSSGKAEYFQGAAYSRMTHGASYRALYEFFSRSRLTASSSIFQRITSKLFEAAESRTLAVLLEECLTSSVVTHPDISDIYDDLVVVGPTGKSVSDWASDLRNMSEQDYQRLLHKQDELIGRCFSVDSKYCTSLLSLILEII